MNLTTTIQPRLIKPRHKEIVQCSAIPSFAWIGSINCCPNANESAKYKATAISPNHGFTSGNTFVTILGNDFSGATGASVGGVPLTSFTLIDNHTITGFTGAHAAGLVDVAVTNGTVTQTSPNLYTYENYLVSLDDPTGYYENYPAGAWSSLPSRGTSGSAPQMLKATANYPPNGVALNGNTTVKFNGFSLISNGDIGHFINSQGPNSAVALIKWPSTLTPCDPNYYAGPPVMTDDGGRWGMCAGGSNGGISGVNGGMLYNDAAFHISPQNTGILPAAPDTYHLVIYQWSSQPFGGGTKGGQIYIVDLASTASFAGPAIPPNNYFGIGPRAIPNEDLTSAQDPATSLRFGENYGGGFSNNSIEGALYLTYNRVLSTTDMNNILGYCRAKFLQPP